jgi:hypothetical protein
LATDFKRKVQTIDIWLNICADDVNKHGDVQIKRVGRLTPTDNNTAISGPIFFMHGLKFAETLLYG